MYSYRAYGLGIHSEVPLFDMPVQTVVQDVTIVREKIDVNSVEVRAAFPYLKLDAQEAIFAVDGVGRFRVMDGRRIVVDPESDAGERLVQSFLLGNALALLLYQRKRLLLHASVISINQKGVAFLGDSGAGKSSIAAAFLANGHKLLVDDLASIEVEAGEAWINPGFPSIKLGKDALSLFTSDPDKLLFIDTVEDKTLYRIKEWNVSNRELLQNLFIIKTGEEVAIEPINSQQALLELMRFSVPPSMVKLKQATHFVRCVELLKKVQIHSMRRPESLAHLRSLVTTVEEFIA